MYGSRLVAVNFITQSTRWRWMVSFMLQPSYNNGKRTSNFSIPRITIHHHHHHVHEGLGVFPVPWSSKWSWSLHLFFSHPMFLRPFGLCCGACFVGLFVSILCMCCSHFSWYCFISFTMSCAPVFPLIHRFFSLSSEHRYTFKTNSHVSNYAKHILEQSHSLEPIQDTMQILQHQNKRNHLNTIERFSIYACLQKTTI
jgi:hypothetical protein